MVSGVAITDPFFFEVLMVSGVAITDPGKKNRTIPTEVLVLTGVQLFRNSPHSEASQNIFLVGRTTQHNLELMLTNVDY